LHLAARKELLERQSATINELNTALEKIMSDGKVLYASTKAWADTTIKREEELTVRIHAVDEWERVVEELEQKRQEREGLDDIELDHKLEALVVRTKT
jgi:hypothetical protein